MVAFTITPSRAAARLNSGVRPLQRKVLGTKHLRHRQLQWDSPAMCCASYARTAPDSKLSLRPQHRPHACCASALASFIASPGHRLRADQSAGPPLWTWLVRKEPSSALHSAQDRGEQLAGSGLTIRSSRDRFAASAWRRRLCHRRGRKSVRLNSGVRCRWSES